MGDFYRNESHYKKQMKDSYDKMQQENSTFMRDSQGFRRGGYREPSPLPASQEQVESAMQKLLE